MNFRNNSFENARLTKRTVLDAEIDELGHVNNAIYVQWIQEAATEHWHSAASEEMQSAFIWFCSRHEIDYKQQLYAGNNVEIRTWLGVFKGARFDRHVDIRLAGSTMTAVYAVTTWVLISKDSHAPVRIKPEILTVFSS